MAIEIKEILSYLGIPEAEVTDIEKFKEKFNPSFIKKDIEIIRGDEEFHGKILGATVGGIKTALQRVLKKHGIKAEDKVFDGKIHEVVESIIDSTATGFTTKIADLEKNAGKGNDEKLIALQKQFDTLKTEKEAAEGKVTTLQTEYDTFKTGKEKEFSDYKVNSAVEKVYGTFKWANGINDLTKDGFRSRIDKKYKPAFDDAGTLIALNEKGEKVKDDKKNGAFKSYEQVLQEEGVEAKVYAIADNRNQQQQAPRIQPNQNNNDNQHQQVDKPADARRTINRASRPQTT